MGARIVHTGNLDSLARDWEQDATCAARYLKNWPPRLLCEIEVEGKIDQILLRSVGTVVVLGDDVVCID